MKKSLFLGVLGAALFAGGVSLRADNFTWNSGTPNTPYTTGPWLSEGGSVAVPATTGTLRTPALYGTVSLLGSQTVGAVDITSMPTTWAWLMGASSTLTVTNDFKVSTTGGAVSLRLNNASTGSGAINVGKNLELSGGVLLFGQQVATANSQLSALTVTGSTIVASSSTLAFRVDNAQLNGGLHLNAGSMVAVYNSGSTGGTAPTMGGITVSSLNGTSGTVQAALNAAWTSTATLTINGSSGTASFGGLLRNNGAANSLSVVKTGSNTQILSGNNTYTGTTTVTAGTLLINGDQSAATGAVTIGANGSLGGTGTIGGAVSIDNGALVPGQSTGLLTFSAALTLNGDATDAVFEIGGGNRGAALNGYDAVNVGGTLTYDGNLVLTITTGLADGTYDLFSFSALGAGGFDAIAFAGGIYTGPLTEISAGVWNGISGGKDFTFTESTGDLVVSSVPEPQAISLIAGLGLSVLLWRRRLRRH